MVLYLSILNSNAARMLLINFIGILKILVCLLLTNIVVQLHDTVIA